MDKGIDSIKAVLSDPTYQRRQKIYDAAKLLERNEPLPDDLRAVAAETLRQCLAFEFYQGRSLSGWCEQLQRTSGARTLQAVKDLQLLKESSNAGPNVLEAAKLAIQGRRRGIHKAETLVAFLIEAESLSPEKAAEKAAEILGRKNSESILRQYRRYKAKMSAGKKSTKLR